MKQRIHSSLYLILSTLLIFSNLSPVLPQSRKRTGPPKADQTAKAPETKGQSCEKWTGTIEIRTIRKESRTEVTGLGEHMSDQHYTGTHKSNSTFDYRAVLNVSDSRGSVSAEDKTRFITLKGQLSGEASRISEETHNWKTKTDCFPDTPRERVAGKDSYNKISETGQLPSLAESGNMIVKGNYYTISLGVPEIQGTYAKKAFLKPYGWCIMKDNPPSDWNEESSTSFSRAVVNVDGTIDPKFPDKIAGSAKTDEDTTVTWNLTRTQGECEVKLKVTDLTLAHHVFPDKTEWQEVGSETIDGNQVRLTATVENESDKPKSGTLVIEEKKSGIRLLEKPVTVAADSSIEVEHIWDTNGFAWTDDRKPASSREIEARVGSETETEKVLIIPKPVILVHGLWSNAAAWAPYQGFLRDAHTFAWKAFAVGADPANGLMNTGDHFMNTEPTNSVFQNAQELAKQIKHVQQEENAWHVDIVAHSMGGLISRFYIHHYMKPSEDDKPTVKNLVMLGTPNQGSPWADIMFEKFKNNGHHVEALRELKTDVCRTFNAQITNRKGVKFSIVYTDKIPLTGNTREAGDGVVSVSSATWEIADRSLSESLEHTALTGREDFMKFVYPRLAIGPKASR